MQGIYKPLEDASRKRAAEQPDGELSEDEDEEGGSQLSAEESPSDSDGGSEQEPDAAEAGSEGSDSESDASEGGDQVDQEALRLYELSKLRYYYAVVVADSAATAAHLYEECDGMEFMHSACKFDLRFVPDEQVTHAVLQTEARAMLLGLEVRVIGRRQLLNT